MEDLIRASALLTGEDDAEDVFDEDDVDVDGAEKSAGADGEGDDMDISSWEN